jgi:hypothetical protein
VAADVQDPGFEPPHCFDQQRMSELARSHNYWTLAGELPESVNLASFDARFARGFIASNASRRSRTSSSRSAAPITMS